MVGELFGRILVSALALLVDDAGFNSCDLPPNQTRSLCFFGRMMVRSIRVAAGDCTDFVVRRCNCKCPIKCACVYQTSVSTPERGDAICSYVCMLD